MEKRLEQHMLIRISALVSLQRAKLGLTLDELSKETGLSPSYLAEIEKGRKSPSIQALFKLAEGLKIPSEDLLSPDLKRNDDLSALNLFLVEAFEPSRFGLDQYEEARRELLNIATRYPTLSAAFLNGLKKAARSHALDIDHFNYAFLNAYVEETGGSYRKDIEERVSNFLKENDLERPSGIKEGEIKEADRRLRDFLKKKFHCSVRDSAFTIKEARHEDSDSLSTSLRSLWVKEENRLLINVNLHPVQKLFLLCREVGYQALSLTERSPTSPSLEEATFSHLWSDFQSSYFAGVMLLEAKRVSADAKEFFQQKKWNKEKFRELLERYPTTPQMFLYRLSQLMPEFFGIKRFHFMRFEYDEKYERYQLSPKSLNADTLPFFAVGGANFREHYCRRFLAISHLQKIYEVRNNSRGDLVTEEPLIEAQRSVSVAQEGEEFFCFTVARLLTLRQKEGTSITLGFHLNDDFKREVAFWNDPGVKKEFIGSTCERCGLKRPEEEKNYDRRKFCSERPLDADPHIYESEKQRKKREYAFEIFLEEERRR